VLDSRCQLTGCCTKHIPLLVRGRFGSQVARKDAVECLLCCYRRAGQQASAGRLWASLCLTVVWSIKQMERWGLLILLKQWRFKLVTLHACANGQVDFLTNTSLLEVFDFFMTLCEGSRKLLNERQKFQFGYKAAPLRSTVICRIQ
jgi:hypothetical protein